MHFHQGPGERKIPRDCRVLGKKGLMQWGGMGWRNFITIKVTRGRELGLLSPYPIPASFCTSNSDPVCPPVRSPHRCFSSRRCDSCVSAGSHGRQPRTVRCWGNASPRVLRSRWLWVPCTTTLSTGRAPRPLTPRGEHCPFKWVLEGREYKGTGSGCRETWI